MKSPFTQASARTSRLDPGAGAGEAGPRAGSGQLARRHRLSKARGVVLGVALGLAAWSAAIALLRGLL